MNGRVSGSLPRTTALIALGALAVHELRYLLAYGGEASHQLAHQGHGYLTQALPTLIGLSLAILAAGILRAVVGGRPARAHRLARRIGIYAVAIASVFIVQEVVEGILFSGHAAGVDAVLDSGGWLALPLSAAVAAICAILDKRLAAVEAILASFGIPASRRYPARGPDASAVSAVIRRALSPLAFGLARRPPPLAR